MNGSLYSSDSFKHIYNEFDRDLHFPPSCFNDHPEQWYSYQVSYYSREDTISNESSNRLEDYIDKTHSFVSFYRWSEFVLPKSVGNTILTLVFFKWIHPIRTKMAKLSEEAWHSKRSWLHMGNISCQVLIPLSAVELEEPFDRHWRRALKKTKSRKSSK